MRRGLVGGFVVCVVAAVCIAIVQAEQPASDRTNAYVVQLTGPVLESLEDRAHRGRRRARRNTFRSSRSACA